jgi:hypothetical protein
MASWSIVRFELLQHFRLEVEFADGTVGIADLSPRLSQGLLGDGFDPICDIQLFALARLEHGAVCWPGGIELAPDAMYERIRISGISTLFAKRHRVT